MISGSDRIEVKDMLVRIYNETTLLSAKAENYLHLSRTAENEMKSKQYQYDANTMEDAVTKIRSTLKETAKLLDIKYEEFPI